MSHIPTTFQSLSQGWTVTAANPTAVPQELRDAIAAGVPARVPGEVTLDLERAGLVPDPFDGDNEKHQQWIGDVDWHYTCTFDWPDDGNDRQDLVAYGLDTIAEVKLNGQSVGSASNYHRAYRWDIRELLRDKANVLDVFFTSSVRESDRLEQQRGYYPHTEHHAFNQIRKPSYQFGWDWGVDVANAGIWQPIGIDSWKGVRVDAVRPLVDVLPDGTGVLTATVEVERGLQGRITGVDKAHSSLPAVSVTVRLSGHGFDKTVQADVAQGRKAVTVSVKVPHAELWWPLGYGDQPLYDVSVEAGETASWTGRVGFRTTHVDTRADEIGRPFQIYVNNVPVHARGYNWVPIDAFITRGDRAFYAARFRDLVESNSNMVRAWGGSIYETDDFYDLADELGVMVWQDFTLACAAYPEDARTKADIEEEARYQITRLSPHPSLIVWNGSNENYVAYSGWPGYKQALRDDDRKPNSYGYGEKGWGDYYYSELFPELLAELDPTHVYLPSSPMSFTKFVDANKDTDGTMHIWDVWNGWDYRQYAQYTPRFADEFGYQAPPAWSTLNRVVHDKPFEAFGPQMLVHQKAMGGNYKLARGMRSHLTPGNIDDVSFNQDGTRNWLIPTDDWGNMEDWHWACQLQQAQAIRFGVEHMRSLEPVNAGALIWQLNDDWPVVSWAAVDYYGHRKPLWYASRDFFTPRLATLQPRISDKAWRDLSWEGKRPECDTTALVLLNDTRQAWSGSWTIERISLDGTVLASQTADVSLDAISHTAVVLNPDVAAFGDPSDELIVATPDRAGFARTILNGAEVVDQKLDSRPLSASVSKVDGGYRISVRANAYVRDLFCMVDKVDHRATIDDGMATLLPGEEISWTVTSEDVDDPQRFVAPNVLRSANDLKR